MAGATRCLSLGKAWRRRGRPRTAVYVDYALFAEKGDATRLYTFAVESKGTLDYIPCFCGCARFGHTSNRSCYVKDEREGRVTFTSHAAT